MWNVGNQFGQLEYHGENLQPEPTKWISNWLIINNSVCAFVTCVLVCALRFPHQWSSVLINFEITPKCRRGRGCGFSISISVHAFILLNFHSVLPLSLSNISRKISAHEFERGGLLKPIVNTIDGTPTFLSIGPQHEGPLGGGGCGQSQHGTAHGGPSGSHHHLHYRPQRLSRNELRQLDERELIFELVGIDAIYISLAGCDIVTVCVV